MRPKSNSAEKELSTCEKPIMKIVWNAGEDITVQELIEQLRVQFNKEYARTTVVTFLKKLSDKGFVSTYRRGNASYVHPEVALESYRDELLEKDADFWYGGRVSNVMSVMLRSQNITKTEIRKMKEMLDAFDD